MLTISKNLFDAVNKDARSVNAIAIAADIDQASLQRFMAGTRSLTLPTADKLAKELGLELRKSK